MKQPSMVNCRVFIAGGALGALTNWAVSFVLTSLLRQHYLLSCTATQTVNVSVNVAWHCQVTFGTGSGAGCFIRFCALSAVTALPSIALVWAFEERALDRVCSLSVAGMDMNYLVAIFLVPFVVSIINYTLSRRWVFSS